MPCAIDSLQSNQFSHLGSKSVTDDFSWVICAQSDIIPTVDVTYECAYLKF